MLQHLANIKDVFENRCEFLHQGDMAPAAIVMSFGSGQIAAQIASDEARWLLEWWLSIGGMSNPDS